MVYLEVVFVMGINNTRQQQCLNLFNKCHLSKKIDNTLVDLFDSKTTCKYTKFSIN